MLQLSNLKRDNIPFYIIKVLLSKKSNLFSGLMLIIIQFSVKTNYSYSFARIFMVSNYL